MRGAAAVSPIDVIVLAAGRASPLVSLGDLTPKWLPQVGSCVHPGDESAAGRERQQPLDHAVRRAAVAKTTEPLPEGRVAPGVAHAEVLEPAQRADHLVRALQQRA